MDLYLEPLNFNNQTSRWFHFQHDLFNIMLHCFITVILFMGFRFFYIFYFLDKITLELNFETLLSFFYMALKFDIATFSYIAILILSINTILHIFRKHSSASKFSNCSLLLFYYSSITLSVISIFYIQEYNSTFNHFIFLGIYDDKWASLLTFIKEYQPFFGLITIILLSLIIRKTISLTSKKRSIIPFNNRTIVILTLTSYTAFILIANRGGVSHREISRKWSGVSIEPFFNSLIINPVNSLYFAIDDYKQLINEGGTKKNPYSLPKEYSNILKRETQGYDLERPSHIFLIIMESYDSWPKQFKYKNLNISNTYNNLLSDSSYTLNATPASHSTFNSVASIISGIPYSGVNMRHFVGTNRDNLLSLPLQLKSFGYSSHFFYGGLLSWQKIGVFMNEQGVDNLYSGELLKKRKSSDVWGVNDQQLFELVEEKLSDNSFNIILSSSYHPPYNIDLSKAGFNTNEFDKKYSSNYSSLNKRLDPKILGHHWYSDKMLGNFIDKIKKNHPKALFIITGDHYSRRYLHNQPNLFELTQVPIIFHGSKLKTNWANKNASHLDIAPTLMDLITPKKVKYCSFGTSLLNTDEKPKIGYKTLRIGQKIWQGDFSQQYSFYEHKIENEKLLNPTENKWEPISGVDLTYYNSYMGLAWQMVVNPNKINARELCD